MKQGEPSGQVKIEDQYLGERRGADKGISLDTAVAFIQAKKLDKLFDNWDLVDPGDYWKIAKKLLNNRDSEKVLQNIDRFEGIDHNNLVDYMIEVGDGKMVAKFFDKFVGLDALEVANKLFNSWSGDAVATYIDKFDGIDPKEVAEKFLTKDPTLTSQGYYVILKNLEKYPGLDHQKIVDDLMDRGAHSAILSSIDKFEGVDPVEIAQKILDAGGARDLAIHLGSFSGLDQVMANQILLAGRARYIAEHLDSFTELDQQFGEQLVGSLIGENKIDKAIAVNESLKFPDKILKIATKEFSDLLSVDIYKICSLIFNGETTREAADLGVKETGESGVVELREKFNEVRADLISGEIDPDLILNSSLVTDYVMGLVGFEDSEWGLGTRIEFETTLLCYKRDRQSASPLPGEYKSSDVLKVAKSFQPTEQEFVHSEDFLERYRTFVNSIKEARLLLSSEGSLNEPIDFIDQKRNILAEQLEKRAAVLENEKARLGLEKKIKVLKDLDLHNISNPQEAIKVLTSFRGEFDEEIREILLYLGFSLNPGQVEKYDKLDLDISEPTLDDLSWMLNFVDHITNQETLRQYFTDKKARKSFNSLLNTTALKNGMAAWLNGGRKGSRPIKFVPSRDLLTEFSGYIADACWSEMEERILPDHPNIVSLTMVQHPDHPNFERLVGACLLIETTSDQDDPLLVIRGLNPQENMINDTDVNDFYQKLTDYLKQIAKKAGRKLAIVIDEAGEASTNRPFLFSYLENLKKGLKPVKLKSNKDTNFNGYDIRNDSYLVE